VAGLLSYIKQASVRLFDPEREARIDTLSRQIATELKTQRSAFVFDEVVAALGVTSRDVEAVRARVYQMALERAWEDRNITEAERKGLQWVARVLNLKGPEKREVELAVGKRVCEECLAEVLSDGKLTAVEAEALKQIATCLELSVRELMRGYFANSCEAFLRGMFAKMAEDGKIEESELDALLATTRALGMTEQELFRGIEAQARRFVEHVLADAKSDGVLSKQEQETLVWLITRFRLPTEFVSYVESEVRELALMTQIAQGRLPSIVNCQSVLLKAGEIVHFQEAARYVRTRYLKSGTRVDTHDGNLVITDWRLVFNSQTCPLEVGHRKVVDLIRLSSGFELRTSSRGAGSYLLGKENKLAFAIYQAAVRKANQTLVESFDKERSRHIPRDVRQRVWQRYGGQCAECGATQYLEFDHIIPVARGGGNSDSNIQLLCRKCNLSKSDHI